jgi:biotin carboxyl carrier protein
VATSPRIRPDLTAVAVGEAGYDVTDPRSGQVHRLSPDEWRVAQRMDGTIDLDALSQEELIDAADLAERLRALDLVEKPAATRSTEPLRRAITGGWAVPTESKPAAKANPSQVEALKKTVNAPDAEVEEMKKFFRRAPDEEAFARMRRKRATISSGVVTGVGVVAVTAALPLLIYLSFVRTPSAKPVHVTAVVPTDVLELYEGAAPAKHAAAVPVAFAVEGTVATIVPMGTQATARMPLAALGGRDKAEAELVRQQRKLEQLEKKPVKAAKPREAQRKLVADLQAKVAQMQLLAPQAGEVVTVEAKPGDKVAAGQAVLHLVDPMLHAVFSVPAFDASSMGDGASVRLQTAAGRLVTAHVAKVQGELVTLDIDTGAGVKDGDPVRLVRAWLSGMVTLPASAVVTRGGNNVVFVLASGEARAHAVVVYDRAGEQVRIMKGLGAGEQAIVAPPPLMQDGDKATLAP